MRFRWLAALALLAALLQAALLLALQYSESVSAVVEPSASWRVTVPPTAYLYPSVSYAASWRAYPLPVYSLPAAVEPSASWRAYPLPVLSLSFAVEPSAAFTVWLSFRLPRWSGGEVWLESHNPVKLNRLAWVGGLRVTPVSGQAEVTVSGVGELLAVGSCSASGSAVRVWGSCLIGEPVYAAFTVVDPQGALKLGVALFVNGSQPVGGVLYKYPGGSMLELRLSGARMGSVYVNGSKVGVGGDTFTLRLENATMLSVKVVARGSMTINVTKVEVPWRSGDFVRVRVYGKVADADYLAPVRGALVKLYASGIYYDYGVSGDDGAFMVDTLVRVGGSSRLQLTLTAEHDDYEKAEAAASAAVPVGAAGPVGALVEVSPLTAAGALAALAAAAAVAGARAARKRRRGRYVEGI